MEGLKPDNPKRRATISQPTSRQPTNLQRSIPHLLSRRRLYYPRLFRLPQIHGEIVYPTSRPTIASTLDGPGRQVVPAHQKHRDRDR